MNRKSLLQKCLMAVAIASAVLTFSNCKNDDDDNNENNPVIGCDCSQELFYYYQNGKIYLDSLWLNDHLLIGFKQEVSTSSILNLINSTGLFKPVKSSYIPDVPLNMDKLMFAQTKVPKTCTELKSIINSLQQSPLVSYASLTFKGTFCIGWDCTDIMAYSNEFLVKVKDVNDLSDLYAVAQHTNTTIKTQNEFMPNLFVLSADKNSMGNALKMSQYFHETGKFSFAEVNWCNTTIGRDTN